MRKQLNKTNYLSSNYPIKKYYKDYFIYGDTLYKFKFVFLEDLWKLKLKN